MKRLSICTPEVISYETLKNYVPSSTKTSLSHAGAAGLTSVKNDNGANTKEIIFPFQTIVNVAKKQPQRRYELASDENTAPSQEWRNDKLVSSSQVLATSMGSPKGVQKIKLFDEKRGSVDKNNSRPSQRKSSTNNVSIATTAKTSLNISEAEYIVVENKKVKLGGLEISTDSNYVKYTPTNRGSATGVTKSQMLKPRDINETNEGPLKKNNVSDYYFELNSRFNSHKDNPQRESSKEKLKPQVVHFQTTLRSSTPKNYTVKDEHDVSKSQQHKSGILSKLLNQASQKGATSTTPMQKFKNENLQEAAPRVGNVLKFNNFFSIQERKSSQPQAKGSGVEDLADFEEHHSNVDKKVHNSHKIANRTTDNLKQVIQQVRSEVNSKEIPPASAKDKKSSTMKDVSGTVGKFFQNETTTQIEAQNAKVEKVSLQSFVTKVPKGGMLNTSIQILRKQDGESAKKPSFKLEMSALTQQKLPRSNFSKTPKTTANSENRLFIFNTTESKTPQTSGQINATLTKQIRAHSPKNLKSSTSLPRKNKEEANASHKSAVITKPVESAPFIYYMSSLEKHLKKYSERDYFCQLFREHFNQSFQALTFVKQLKAFDPKMLNSKKVNLPRRSGCEDKKTVVFDLDETLIHCNESLELPYHIKLPIKFPQGEIVEAGINIRPYAVEALKELSQHFEIIVFTASQGCYANVVLDQLDPKGQYVHHRLFRESCIQTEEGIYVKDLRVLANRDLNDVVLVDNAAYSFAYQIDNGIPIAPYYDNPEDEELKHLIPYLKFLNGIRDMKEINRQTFKLSMYSLYDSLEKVLEEVVLNK